MINKITEIKTYADLKKAKNAGMKTVYFLVEFLNKELILFEKCFADETLATNFMKKNINKFINEENGCFFNEVYIIEMNIDRFLTKRVLKEVYNLELPEDYSVDFEQLDDNFPIVVNLFEPVNEPKGVQLIF